MINAKMRELGAKRSVIRETFEYGRTRKAEIGEDKVFDFSLGNPSVPAPPEVNAELVRLIECESSVALHGYTSAQGDATVRAAIARYINESYGECVNADCLYMTVGAAGALTATLTALVCEGEEVVIPSPYFPEYKVFVERCGATVVAVPCDRQTMELGVAAIEAAVTERCAAVIINSPNIAFDFWNNHYLGTVHSRFAFEVPKCDCRVVALREIDRTRPLLLSTSRHVASPAFDVSGETWDAESRTLSGESKTVAGEAYELRVYVPDHFRCREAPGARFRQSGNLLRVEFADPGDKLNWKILFDEK